MWGSDGQQKMFEAVMRRALKKMFTFEDYETLNVGHFHSFRVTRNI
jgi:hypothetical protein